MSALIIFYTAPEINPDYPLWMKGKGKDDWESEKLIATLRAIQPDIMIDNRAGIEQDIATHEQYQMLRWPTDKETGEYPVWEACQTFSGSWGYFRDESTWKSLLKWIILQGRLSQGQWLFFNTN